MHYQSYFFTIKYKKQISAYLLVQGGIRMNKVILMGRLTRDPEVRYSNNANGEQLAIARYTLAVDRRTKAQEGQNNADFIRCVGFGRSGEFAEKYFHQGTKIVVEGRIQTGSYQDKDGKTVYTTEVVVENQEFAESKHASDNYNAQNQNPSVPETTQPMPDPGTGFTDIPDNVDDSGLPFNF